MKCMNGLLPMVCVMAWVAASASLVPRNAAGELSFVDVVVIEDGLEEEPQQVVEGPVEVAIEAVEVLEPLPAQQAPVLPGGGLLGFGVRAVLNAIAPPQVAPPPVDEADDGEMPKDPQQAQLWQQRKQIRAQARHLEQLFQPVLRTELEMIRQACPGLPPEVRRDVFAAGRAAVTKTALEYATRQMLGGRPERPFDAHRTIQESLATAIEPHVAAGVFSAYQREQARRLSRRAEAARVAIVAKLDRRLELSSDQRSAIEQDLADHWSDEWLRELDDNGMIINNERPAPDYANACIEHHLSDGQRREWDRWRKAAGVAVVGMHVGWNFDGQGLHQEDPWWTR